MNPKINLRENVILIKPQNLDTANTVEFQWLEH